MKEVAIVQLSLEDLCRATALSSDILIEITEEGIIEPIGNRPDNWQFNVRYVETVQKAARLHRDLGIEWPGVALAMSLIEELEQLRQENWKLKLKLHRLDQNVGS